MIEQVQVQNLSPQQVLTVRLTEMPLEELIERIGQECMENPWLEETSVEKKENAVQEAEKSKDDAYYDYSSEDDAPYYLLQQKQQQEEKEMGWNQRQGTSLLEFLKEQIGEYELTERQQSIMEYIVGSLDDDGLLRRPLWQIIDELVIYHNIRTTEEELEELLHVLWQFDPPGIGARSLQECLLLQIERREVDSRQQLMREVVKNHFESFMKKRWDIIRKSLLITDEEADAVRREILRLNPRPGTSLGEGVDEISNSIIPDFFVETDPDGHLTLTLNEGDIPALKISADAEVQEEEPFVRSYVEKGRLFINALKQRRESMLRTMRAILKLQYSFFTEGDESLLRPMILEDVAKLAGLDISTVSRVAKSKYVQTAWGTYRLRWFFSGGTTQDGSQVSVRKLLNLLREMVDKEDKENPLSDEELSDRLHEKGFQVARRTVAKYRKQLNIPVARLRKE